jgi:hypothetical protein
MYNAYHTIGVMAGSGALTYLASGKNKNDQTTLRLTLGESNALIYDVRFIGGSVCALASMFLVKGKNAKSLLNMTSFAAFTSLISTEIVKMRLSKEGAVSIPKGTIFSGSDAHAMPSYGAYGRSKIHA